MLFLSRRSMSVANFSRKTATVADRRYSAACAVGELYRALNMTK